MDKRDHHDPDDESDAQRPSKRPRHTPSPGTAQANSNRNGNNYAPALPPLSLSILGAEPMDEFIREVADFVHAMMGQRPEGPGTVEVEAKVGVIRDKISGERLQMPILVETILIPGAIDTRFESNMSAMQHKHFNELLNNLMLSSKSSSAPTATPVSYTHLRHVDNFYSAEGDRIRVTRDEKTGEVVACVRKLRLGDLDVYSPKRAGDWRISVSVEIPVAPPIGTPTHTRRKDRLSYAHEECIIDLTQVTSSSGGPNGKVEVLHELEVELARPDYVLAAAAKRNDPSVSEEERGAFDELIRVFVNNARVLVRNAGVPGK